LEIIFILNAKCPENIGVLSVNILQQPSATINENGKSFSVEHRDRPDGECDDHFQSAVAETPRA
jgi:hypothetical protein